MKELSGHNYELQTGNTVETSPVAAANPSPQPDILATISLVEWLELKQSHADLLAALQAVSPLASEAISCLAAGAMRDDAVARQAQAHACNSHDRLVAALKAMVRCPGIHTTDQVTGETFARIVMDAIGK